MSAVITLRHVHLRLRAARHIVSTLWVYFSHKHLENGFNAEATHDRFQGAMPWHAYAHRRPAEYHLQELSANYRL